MLLTEFTGENVQEQVDLADFYRNMSEKSSKNKTAIKNILEGDSKVFMLRIDREEHNGNFDSRIEETRGAAWIADLDVPQKLRNAGKNKNPEYIYKYSKIFDPKQKTEILKKYLPGKKFDQANYKIAQVEIPNCENPAIVIKKKPTQRPAILFNQTRAIVI